MREAKAALTLLRWSCMSFEVDVRTSSMIPRNVADAMRSLSAFSMFSLEKDSQSSGVTDLKGNTGMYVCMY